MSESNIAVPLTPVLIIGLVSVLFVKVCEVVKSAVTEVSISISFAFTVIPVPPIAFTVTSPDVPPPVRPAPATTPVSYTHLRAHET